MIVETVITSVPRGLKAGRTGYQPVMRTRGLRDDVLRQLEPLTGYRHIHRQGSGKNPVNYTYRRLASNVGDLAVLARTVDAGSDFSNRSNKCGHLIAFTADEIGRLSRTTPAALLADNAGLFASQWTKGPEERPAPPALAAQPQTPAICTTWQSQFGDAGWAAVVAERARRRQPTLLVAPDSSPQSSELLLLLIREATALLPPADRWAVSFETTVLGASDALIQGTYRGSPEAEATRQGVLVLPLGGPVPPGQLQENELCKLARFGPPQPAAAAPPPVAPTATLPPAGEDFLSNSPTAPVAGSPPPLQPSTPNRRVGSFEPLPKGKQVPWGTIIGASVLFPFIAFCVAWFIWSTISAEIVQRRDDARKTLTTYANYDFLNGEKDNQDAPPAPPTAETWNLARLSSLDATPNDAWVKNANFILRLKGVNGDCVRDWSTEDPTNENHKKILSLINKPTNEFTIDDFVSLGILKSSPDKKYETQVLSFLNPAFSSGELQLLDNANALVTALQSLSDLPNQSQEPTTAKLDEVAKAIEGCQWRYNDQLIWPSYTSQKNRVVGYAMALCSSDAPVISERTPAYFLEIMNTQAAAITKLKKYRLKNKETKPPTDHDYQLAYGRIIVPDDLKQYNDALAEFPPDVLPQFEALHNKAKPALKTAAERMDQQPPDSSPSHIFSELESHFKVERNRNTSTLASDVKDLDKLKDLTPRAWSLKGAAPHLEFKRDSNPQSGDRVWLASVNNSPAGRLEIKPAEKKVIFSVTEGAPTLAYYTPIDLTWNGRSTPSNSLENKPKTVELRSDQSIRDLIEGKNVKVEFDGGISKPLHELKTNLRWTIEPRLKNVLVDLKTSDENKLLVQIKVASEIIEPEQLLTHRAEFQLAWADNAISLTPLLTTSPYFTKPSVEKTATGKDLLELAWAVIEPMKKADRKKPNVERPLVTAIRFQEGNEKDCLSPEGEDWYNQIGKNAVITACLNAFNAGVPTDPSKVGGRPNPRLTLGAMQANELRTRSWEAMLLHRIAITSERYNKLQAKIKKLQELEQKKADLSKFISENRDKKGGEEQIKNSEKELNDVKKDIAELIRKEQGIREYKNWEFEDYCRQFAEGHGVLYESCEKLTSEHDGSFSGKADSLLDESILMAAYLALNLRHVAAMQEILEQDAHAELCKTPVSELFRGKASLEFVPPTSGDAEESKTITVFELKPTE